MDTSEIKPSLLRRERSAPKRVFESFSENWRKKFFELLVAKYQLQGKSDPEKRALDKIGSQPKQTKKAWQRQVFYTMQAIDKERLKMGLKAIHF